MCGERAFTEMPSYRVFSGEALGSWGRPPRLPWENSVTRYLGNLDWGHHLSPTFACKKDLGLKKNMSSGLEASIAGTETHMLGELSYALPASAQYMKKRVEIYWTSGANVYAANGIRTMRVNISGQGFLDMSSLVLECDVDNLSTNTALSPNVPGLEAFFNL